MIFAAHSPDAQWRSSLLPLLHLLPRLPNLAGKLQVSIHWCLIIDSGHTCYSMFRSCVNMLLSPVFMKAGYLAASFVVKRCWFVASNVNHTSHWGLCRWGAWQGIWRHMLGTGSTSAQWRTVVWPLSRRWPEGGDDIQFYVIRLVWPSIWSAMERAGSGVSSVGTNSLEQKVSGVIWKRSMIR